MLRVSLGNLVGLPWNDDLGCGGASWVPKKPTCTIGQLLWPEPTVRGINIHRVQFPHQNSSVFIFLTCCFPFPHIFMSLSVLLSSEECNKTISMWRIWPWDKHRTEYEWHSGLVNRQMGHYAGQTFLCAGRKSFLGPSLVILTPSRGKVTS